MAKQQKRRRKRYDPGSVYAGDVRPTGVLGFLGSRTTIRVIFIGMALALAVGGGAAIFGGSLMFGGTGRDPDRSDFIVQDDEDDGEGTSADPTAEAPRYVALPELTLDPEKDYLATIRTDLGDIEVELFAAESPQTVNNFVFLAREGFYDGLSFSYVSAGFSAQAGEVSSGGPAYGLPAEDSVVYEKGTLGMADASQFFFALSGAQADLEEFEDFNAFGKISSGQDVAESLTRGTTIQSVEILEQ